MPLLFQRNSIFRTYFKHQGNPPTTFKDTSHSKDAPTNNLQTSLSLSWISWVLQEMYQGFSQNSKTIDPPYLTASEIWRGSNPSRSLPGTKDSIIQVLILCYPNPNKKYIVYTDASDDACRAQLIQEHDGTEFPITFLSHTFLETQRKWSTTEQEACGVYYTITKCNYYLQGADIIGMITSPSLNFWMERMQMTK